MLERPPSWPHFRHLRSARSLRAELAAFIREQGLPPKEVLLDTPLSPEAVAAFLLLPMLWPWLSAMVVL